MPPTKYIYWLVAFLVAATGSLVSSQLATSPRDQPELEPQPKNDLQLPRSQWQQELANHSVVVAQIREETLHYVKRREAPLHVVDSAVATQSTTTLSTSSVTNLMPKNRRQRATDLCSDRLCYGLPEGCIGSSSSASAPGKPNQLSAQTSDASMTTMASSPVQQGSSLCTVLVTSKRIIDPYRVASRDIMFELIALPQQGQYNYAAVGFSENGRMQGFVSECLQSKDKATNLHMVKLRHSYNLPNEYDNVPVQIISGIKNLGVTYENGYYQCRWIVETSVEFSYEARNGTLITTREDLGYKNYHILLAAGRYNLQTDTKEHHELRSSSMAPVSLAQTGQIKSLGAHILIKIHGSLMVTIWAGLVTFSIFMARYYKNEWSNSKVNDVAVWFVTHRTFMLIAWFGSIIAVMFAYMYTESYHPGLHQISGSACLILSTVQILGGLFRPSLQSSRRPYFNWAHFVCGNISYLLAMVCLITAAFLAPAHLPPVYIWIIVAFVGTYVLIHTILTIHQYFVHRSSKISITPMGELNSNSSTTYTTGFIEEEVNSPFRQLMLGILVTIIVIYIVLLLMITTR